MKVFRALFAATIIVMSLSSGAYGQRPSAYSRPPLGQKPMVLRPAYQQPNAATLDPYYREVTDVRMRGLAAGILLQLRQFQEQHKATIDKVATLETRYPAAVGPGGRLALAYDSLLIGNPFIVEGAEGFAATLASILNRSEAGAPFDAQALLPLLQQAQYHLNLSNLYLAQLQQAYQRLSYEAWRATTPESERYRMITGKSPN